MKSGKFVIERTEQLFTEMRLVSDIGVTVLANCQYRGDKTSIALVYLRPRLSRAALLAKKIFSTDNI